MKVPLPNVSSSDEEFQMAPMIDMVFLLLIFFMVSSNLNQAERIPIRVPLAKNAEVPKELSERLTITILPPLDGREEKVYVGAIPVNAERLEATVSKFAAQHRDPRVYLRADKKVHHKKVREVMNICAKAGAPNIVFATLQTEAGS